jgi:FeS assembly SUF system regulator
MLRISKLTDYAILVMVELCAAADAVLSAQAIGQRLGLEPPTVSKVLKLLARAGLVQSRRGVNGGYSIDRNATNISVAEIIAAIEGPIAMTECSVEVGLCSQEDNCGLRGNWQRISAAVAAALEGVSLAEMSRPAGREARALKIATFNS